MLSSLFLCSSSRHLISSPLTIPLLSLLGLVPHLSSSLAAALCSKATELVAASVGVGGEIKSLIVTTQARRMEAQDKVSSAISKKVEEADRVKV